MTHIIATICASFLADAECREVSMPSHVPPQMCAMQMPALLAEIAGSMGPGEVVREVRCVRGVRA